MLTVLEPAATTGLTTLDMLKLALGITTDDDDDYLEMQIVNASSFVCGILNVAAAQDGTRNLGLETLEEYCSGPLLSRVPIVSIEAMADGNGDSLDPADYLVDKITGRLFGANTRWANLVYNYTPPALPMLVTYKAGWLLPGEDGRNLPPVIESATISRISSGRAGRGRDPAIKAERIPGVMDVEYWVGSTSSGGDGSGIPPDIMSQLSLYRRYTV